MDVSRVALGATSAPCPTAAGKAGATCVHAIAGFTNFTDFATDTAEFFTPAANDWSPLPDLATARFEPAAATAPCPKSAKSVRTCMYALGGLNDTSFTALNSVEALPVGR
ncbi:hypothetical protein [Streptomyces sp. NPDC058755]|uniref:hypothetical protein n=1 Tax=Streptomyces sp. NPDC058755 TaxID=3346624 RepID=UPI00368FF0F1